MTEASDACPESLRGVVIVANPYSGAKENRACVEALAAALRQRQLEPRVIWDLDELVAVANDPCSAERYRVVVVAGGDGTLNRVINLQRRLPLFVFPLGNENLFSRELGCCCVPEHAADVIAGGRTQTLDLGRAGEQLFSIVASAGFDGDAAHRLARWRRQADRLRRVWSVDYAVPVLKSAWRYRYPPIDVNADGHKVRGALCMVFNVPQYANRLPLAFDADPHDGLLDWVVFEKPGNLRLMRYALSVWLKQHRQRADVHHGRARRVVLGSSEPVPLEIDGEAADFAPVTIEVVPDAIRVIVPQTPCACHAR
ncbi:MAG TPA: diacylglycerol kinase family protein [Pirellulales bacterium]|jgi:diacylglycerol kinase family enzyme|nr:diacylglycerol kinase family protein [Pirellulales bacterium]